VREHSLRDAAQHEVLNAPHSLGAYYYQASPKTAGCVDYFLRRGAPKMDGLQLGAATLQALTAALQEVVSRLLFGLGEALQHRGGAQERLGKYAQQWPMGWKRHKDNDAVFPLPGKKAEKLDCRSGVLGPVHGKEHFHEIPPLPM